MKSYRYTVHAIVFYAALLFVLGNGPLQSGPLQAETKTDMVKTTKGPVSGLKVDGLQIFKGIPYAKPPVGDLRFAPPQDAEPWTEPLKCEAFGPMPPQPAGLNADGSEPVMSEDCLTLNVWAPESARPGSKLPVYMFIYGGAYTAGASSIPLYDGANFAKSGVVFVSLNYRLNALGFLASRETLKQYGTTGNWGHLDQIKALEWIRDNIAAFGGDPDNVTIGGESAGSFSCSALVLSPLARGLFHKAILESGTILSVPSSNTYGRGDLERSINQSLRLGESFGVKSDDAEGLAAFRAADAATMAQMCLFNVDFINIMAYFFMPVFDGRVLPENPRLALEKGEFNQVGLLFGFNKDEGSIFIPRPVAESQYQALATYMYGSDLAGEYLAAFPVDAENTPQERARELISLAFFQAEMKTLADALVKHGRRDVYGYYFSYALPEAMKNGLGARHGAEMAYAFKNLAAGGLSDPTPDQQKLAEEVHTRWVNFIKNGDPNKGTATPSKVAWPRYEPESGAMLRLDTEVKAEPMPGRPEIEFVQTLSAR